MRSSDPKRVVGDVVPPLDDGGEKGGAAVGRELTKRVDYPLGNALNPVSDKQLEGKFNALVVPALGEVRAQKIVDLAWKLEEAKNVDELMSTLVMNE